MHLAPHFRQVLHRVGGEECQSQQLQQGAGRHGVRDDHGHGGLIQQGDHTGENHGDHQTRQETSGAKLGAGGLERFLNRIVETAGDGVFLSKGLDSVQRPQPFAGVTHCVGETILSPHGKVLQPAAEQEHGRQEGRDQQQDQAGDIGADDHHPYKRADQGNDVAGGYRHHIADHALDHGHVGSHTRKDFAQAQGDEVLLLQVQNLAEHHLAHIGDHPFAELIEKIKAKPRGKRQGPSQNPGQSEGVDQGAPGMGGETVVYDPAHAAGQGQKRR